MFLVRGNITHDVHLRTKSWLIVHMRSSLLQRVTAITNSWITFDFFHMPRFLGALTNRIAASGNEIAMDTFSTPDLHFLNQSKTRSSGDIWVNLAKFCPKQNECCWIYNGHSLGQSCVVQPFLSTSWIDVHSFNLFSKCFKIRLRFLEPPYFDTAF